MVEVFIVQNIDCYWQQKILNGVLDVLYDADDQVVMVEHDETDESDLDEIEVTDEIEQMYIFSIKHFVCVTHDIVAEKKTHMMK